MSDRKQRDHREPGTTVLNVLGNSLSWLLSDPVLHFGRGSAIDDRAVRFLARDSELGVHPCVTGRRSDYRAQHVIFSALPAG
jgi:hypothetical protein